MFTTLFAVWLSPCTVQLYQIQLRRTLGPLQAARARSGSQATVRFTTVRSTNLLPLVGPSVRHDIPYALMRSAHDSRRDPREARCLRDG